MSYKKLEIFIDGASSGNPGRSSIGIVICNGGEVIKNISKFIGEATNNIAEYTALIYGMQEALILKAKELVINTDSELLFRQLKGEYKVKNPGIRSLFEQAEHLFAGFDNIEIKQIPREKNRGADKLAQKAIKEQAKVVAPTLSRRGKSELKRESVAANSRQPDLFSG